MSNKNIHYAPLDVHGGQVYFAGANTAAGFVNGYHDHYSESKLDRIYILKGGSGTGKSTLIRTCAAQADPARTTLLLCSSDPSSVDAAILQTPDNRTVAILDGTAPHTVEPQIPGAVSEIIDLGRFWNHSFLSAQKQEIVMHLEAKKTAYHRAYTYLHAINSVRSETTALLRECFLAEKAAHAAERILSRFHSEKAPIRQRRFTYAHSMRGTHRLTTFEDHAKQQYRITDSYGSGTLFTELLMHAIDKRAVSSDVSPLPAYTGCIGELLLPGNSVSFRLTMENETLPDHVHCINMYRFLNRSDLAERRGKLRFAANCIASLAEAVDTSLAEAGTHHFALEEIYRSAMDFAGVHQISEELCTTLFPTR